MCRVVVALLVSVLMLVPFGGTALAKCATCFDSLSLQTPDGQPWSAGKPVTLVVQAHGASPTTALAPTGVAVVMHTDGDRTKCLEVPLRLVSTSGTGATYAGIFYPFRAAAYDGKLALGDETFDIAFDVRTLVPTTAVASTPDLPVAAPDPDTSYPLLDGVVQSPLLPAVVALVALGALAASLIRRRRVVAFA